MKNAKIIALLNSSSLTRPLLLLSTASALLGSGPAQALDVNALPQGGAVVGGSATISQSGSNTLNVNQSSNRTVINWQSFNIGSAATTNFNQPSSSAIAVNQVNASTNPSVIQGTLNANGQVWILNPNGVYFGKTATVNASGIVASTAHIDVNAFMAGSNQLQMTGGDSGSVVNKGKITVGQGGLAAFVAPSVRNSGTIIATVGKVTLAAGDTYTLDLAGDHLVELGLGATKAVVDQSGKIVNPGGTVQITAKAATQVVDSVINMSGVVDASSVSGNGGSITLAADTINTTSTAQLNASGGGTGNGGSISAVANNTGNYDGSFTAKGGAQGGNGGTIETSGQNIVIAPSISVDASAANGAAGSWTMDPHNVTIQSGAATGGFAGSTVNSGAILNSLDKGTNVTINATTGSVAGQNGDITLSTTISATPNAGVTSTGNLTLRGNDLSNGSSGNTINIAGGGSLILDVNAASAATASNPDTAGATFIGDALGLIGNVSGGATVNLGGSGATTYTEQVTINNPNTAITLAGGFGSSTTTIAAPVPTGPNFAEISVLAGTQPVTIQNLTVSGGNQGNGLSSFNGIQITDASATIKNVDINGFQDSTLDGAQHGVGLSVSEDDGGTYSVALTNSSIEDFQKNATAFKDSNPGGSLTLDIENNTITGSGNTSQIAQNGIEIYGSNGATINSTIVNNTITGISYANSSNDSTDIMLLGTNGTSTISGNTVTGTNAGAADENSIGLYISGANSVTATNNNFTNLGYGIDADTFFGPTGSVSVSGGKISGNQEGIYVDPTVNSFSAQNINFSNNSIIFQGSSSQETDLINNNSLGANTVVNATPDGNIYGTLQSAVDGEASASTLDITGTLIGQTVIDGKTFTLVGTGTTPGKTVLEAPTSMVNSFVTQVGGIVGQGVQAVIAAVDGANVTIKNLTVNGESNAAGNPFLVGIGANNSTLSVDNVRVTGVADSSLGANPGGIGIGVYNEDGTARSVSITNSTVDNFGATGISLQGGALTATVTGNTITGAGSTGADRQIGIELYGLAETTPTSGPITVTGTITGTVSGNTVTKVSYSGAGDSVALNLVDTNDVTASDNTLTGVNTTDSAWGIAASGSDGLTISDNNISKFETGVEAFSYWGQQNVTITNNAITGNAIGVGLDSFGVNPDSSTVTATDNSLAGNAQSVVNNLNNANGANFAQNWWGTANDATIQASIGGSAAGSVDFSPFLTNGQNGTPGNGFTGDLADLTVTSLGNNLSSKGRIQTGINDVAATTGGTSAGTVTVIGGLYSGEEVTVGGADSDITIKLGTVADPVTGVDSFLVHTAATGVELSGDLQANAVTLNGLVTLAGNLVLDTTAGNAGAGGDITIASVDGASADAQNLTLKTGGGTASLGDVSNPYAVGSAQPELGTVTDTGNITLTGSQYYAQNFNLGAVTLTDTGNTINIHGSSANTAITLGSVDDDVANSEALTLMAPNGSIHVGNIGASVMTATVFDSDPTVFTGSKYDAQSFQMGAVRLTSGTTAITSGAGGISIGSLDGTGKDAQSVTLTANGGSTVSLGDIGDTTPLAGVTSTGATTLTGTNYEARNFDFGALTLAAPEAVAGTPSVATITADGANATRTGIIIASVDDAKGEAGEQSLTLGTAGSKVSLGNAGANVALGDFIDSANATTLTGTTYTANTVSFTAATGELTLGASAPSLTTITANDAVSADTGITIGSVDGNAAGQSLTLATSGSSVSLGNAGTKTALGDVIDTAATTLTGTTYNANTFTFGSLLLDPTGAAPATPTTTTITANSTSGGAIITIGSVDGQFNDEQNLTLNAAGGTVSLGNVDTPVPVVPAPTGMLGVVTDTNNQGTTLTGTTYEAESFAFGAVTLAAPEVVAGTPSVATITADDATAADVGITIASVDGSTADQQSLTLGTAGSQISLGNAGANVALGNVIDTAATTLIGTTYEANTFNLGSVLLDPTGSGAVASTTTTITADGTGANIIAIGSINGEFGDDQNLTLNAAGGTVSLGNVGTPGSLTVVGGVPTLVPPSGMLGDVTDTNNQGTTLTGSNYEAAGFAFGDITLTQATTNISTDDDNLSMGSVTGAGDALNLFAGKGTTATMGNVGVNGALGAVVATDGTAIILTGTTYKAESFDLGDVTLAAPEAVAGTPSVTTITASDATTADTGITIASVQGTSGDTQSLTLVTSGSSVSLGDVSNPYPVTGPAGVELATLTAAGNVTLTGNQYYAQNMDLGAVTLTDTNATINLHVSGPNMTIGSVDDDVADHEALTLMAPNGAIKVGNIGGTIEVGTVFDVDPTTFTGTKYEANQFEIGALTLGAADGTTTTIKADTTGGNGIIITSLDGTDADQQNVTLTAKSLSLGNAGANKALGAVTSTDPTTLTGTTYEAESFNLGQVTLDNTTTITADDATSTDTGITIASVGGTADDAQGLTLATSGSSVSLGDVGATPSLGQHPLGAVTSTSATTLTGDTYEAESFDLGAVTLAATSTVTTVTADDATTTDAGITIASVDGSTASGANTQSFGYGTAGSSVSLGNAGATTPLEFFSTDGGNLGTTTLTGTTYEASDITLEGPIVLDPTGAVAGTATNTTITADGGLLELLGGVDGKYADEQGLTLVSSNDSVTLGNMGANTPLGAVSSTTANGTALIGTTYEAESFDLGPIALEALAGTGAGGSTPPSTTTITADDATAKDTGITISSVDGITAGGQSLTLSTSGSSVMLGNVGATFGLQPLGDVNDSAATTLTGSTYNANTFDFGALTLQNTTTITANSTSGSTIITIGSVKGAAADTQGLTLDAAGGTVSLGDVDISPSDALGDVTSLSATTLTGTTYDAKSFDFGAVTLDPPGATGVTTTSVTSDNGGITMTSVSGTTAGDQNLTLTATGGSVSLGDVGVPIALGTLDINGATTLTGSTYDAASFDFGALTLTNDTTLDSSSDNGAITIGSVNSDTGAGTNSPESLTLTAGSGKVSLGNVGNTTALNSLTDTANGGTTLTGTTYNATTLEFSDLTLGTASGTTTTMTATGTGTAIIINSVKGTIADKQNLTLNAANGTVSLGDVDPVPTDAPGNIVDTNNLGTTLTGTNYEANSFAFGAVTLDNNTTITADATGSHGASAGTIIGIGSVGGFSAGGQTLTLSALGGTVSLGNVGNTPALGSVTDTSNKGTTLTGSQYEAASFAFGALTLDNTSTITADTGNITTGTIDGLAADAQGLTLTASHGTVSLGDIGDSKALGAVTSAGATTLTGTKYDAASFNLGALTLKNSATITADTGSITTGTIDGTSKDNQNLTLTASNGTVSIGDIGDHVALGNVTDTGTTTLTGSQYEAASFNLGTVTLQNSTTIGADTGNITIGSVDGSNPNAQSLTLEIAKTGALFGGKGGTVSLGNTGLHTALGAVVDTDASTTLTGNTYEASSFDFADLTLAPPGSNNRNASTTTTITTDNGGSITTGTIDGTNADKQALVLNAKGGNVSLGDIGDNTPLGAVTDTNNNGTALTGNSYEAASLALGNVTLDNTSTITADTGGISTGTIDGTSKDGQGLTLSASNGTVSLGDIGDKFPLGAVVDTNNQGTTLTGTKYEANSFAFGAVTLDNSTTITADATGSHGASAGTIITIGSVNGTTADVDNLTLIAAGGTVSLGDVDASPADALGNVIDTNNRGTTLTGTTYEAASFDFGNVTLAGSGGTRPTATTTTITTDNGGSITTGTIDGTNANDQNLVLNAAGGQVSLGDIGDITDLGAVTDTNNSGTTLTGGGYGASSFAFGALTLDKNTGITADTGNISTGTIDGTSNDAQTLTLTASRGTVSLGDIGDIKHLGTVIDTANNGTTLTGSNYDAASFAFGALKLTTASTAITADTGSITTGTIDGTTADAQALTLTATNGTVSLGDIGDSKALGAVLDTANKGTTLTGTKYEAASFDFGALKLDNDTTIKADSGNIITGKIDGSSTDNQDLTLTASNGTVSLGDIGDTTHLGNVIDTANQGTVLTGTKYDANSFVFGAVTLDNTTTITADETGFRGANAGTIITIGSVNGTTPDVDGLTLNAAGGTVSLGDVDVSPIDALGNVIDTNNRGTLLTGTTYEAASFDFGNVTLAGSGGTHPTTTTTTITTDNGGSITTGTIDGTNANDQNLVLNAAGGQVSLGDIGDITDLGAVTDTNNSGTTLTGGSYGASSFAFGALTLDKNTGITADTGNISTGTIDGTSNDAQTLTLIAHNGTVSLGDIGDIKHLGTVIDTNNNGTTLTGSKYDAASFAFGNVTLDNTTTVTADTGNITTAKIDGSTPDNQGLTLTASHGTVSVGDIGDTTHLGAVTSTGATTLTGTSYKAASFDLGNVKLDPTGTLSGTKNTTTIATDNNGSIITGTIDGTFADNQALTLTAGTGTVSLGDIGDNVHLGAVIDTVNGGTTLTGTKYEAASFALGNVTLDNSTTITTDNGGSISTGKIDGTAADTQNLTLNAKGGTVSLGDIGDGKALGIVTDTNNNGTTLTGTKYDAASFAFGALTLDNTTSITADTGSISTGTIDGAAADTQGLTLTASNGTVSLGDIGDTEALGAVTSLNATTLTGTKYDAESFDLGAVTLTNGTSITSDDATIADTGITIGSVDGSAADQQSLTLATNGSSVSLGNAGGNIHLGDVIDTATTTLTGTTYNANTFDFGALTLDNSTIISADSTSGAAIVTIGSVKGVTADTQALTINAPGGTVMLGDVDALPSDALGAVIDTNNQGTTLTGNNYDAASFAFGNLILDNTTTITADTGNISTGTIDGTSKDTQGLTLVASKGTVSLGDIGDKTPLGLVTDTNNKGTTLTGTNYEATGFVFGAVVLDPPNATGPTLTTITADDAKSTDTGITMASVDGTTAGDQSLTLATAGSSVSLGDIGDHVALGNLIDPANTTLTGSNYSAASFDFGNLVLKQNTTFTASGNGVAITTGTIDGTSKDKQSLTLNAVNGTVLIGDIGDTTPLGAVTDTNNLGTTLKGSKYEAASFNFGALTLENNTTIGADTGNITIASVDGSSPNAQSLTLETAASLFPGKGGSVSLGNTGLHTALGNVIDTSNTTLTGTTYNASSFDFGNLTLGAANGTTTSITAESGSLTTGTIEGSSKNGQGLTLSATGGVSIGNAGDKVALGNVTDTSNTTLTGTTYEASSFDFGAVTLGAPSTSFLGITIPSTTTITADSGSITTGTIDGTSKNGQSLTLSAPGGVSIADIGDHVALGAVTDLSATTLTGTNYEASSFDFGALTLENSTTITADATSKFGSAGTILTIGSVDGVTADQQNLTLNAAGGTVSLGDVDASPADALGNVIDTNNRGTTLTGTTYEAASFDFANVTLAGSGGIHPTATTTTITTDNGGSITTGTIDGTNNNDQNLVLNAAGGKVSLGDIGDNTDLGAVTDTNNSGTTLTGGSYGASSFAFGALTLDKNTTITADTGNISTGTIDGTSNDAQTLTLTASRGTVTLGDIGDSKHLGAVTDTNNQGTTLNGTNYDAASFAFGNVKIAPAGATGVTNTAITADTGNISAGKIDGAVADDQNLTLSASNGTVSLGDIGDTIHLGNVVDTANKGTTLNGRSYDAASFDFGNVTLAGSGGRTPTATTTTITADTGNIVTGKVDGTNTNDQNLTLNAANGTVSLGDMGDSVHLGAVIDTNNTGTTLTGTNYEATSFAFGAVTLDNSTTITADATSKSGNAGTIITIGSIGAATTADVDDLTLNAKGGTVSLGDFGDLIAPGNVVDTNNQGTTLTGTNYDAASFTFGNVTLDPAGSVSGTATTTTVTADTGNIVTGTVDGAFADDQNLTLAASNGTVTLADMGDTTHLGNVVDTANNGTTLIGTSYSAASFDFGAVALDPAGSVAGTPTTTTINADDVFSKGAIITIGSVDGTFANGQNLTLNTGSGIFAGKGTVSLGNVGLHTALGAVIDTANSGTTLTGTSYEASSFNFANLTLDPKGSVSGTATTTMITTDNGGSIITGTIDSAFADDQNLTLNAKGGTVSLGDIGDTTALGNVIDTNNLGTTLTGTNYEAASFDFGAMTLDPAGSVSGTSTTTTISSDNGGSITAGKIDGTFGDAQALILVATGGTVSLGDIGDTVNLGAVVDTSNNGTTLTGNSYEAAIFNFGNLILDNSTTITAIDSANTVILTGSIDGTSADSQDLTLNAKGGLVVLGDIGDHVALGNVTDTNNLGTGLTGTNYEANSFSFGAVTLDPAGTTSTSTSTTTITADGTLGITIGSIDGTFPGNQSLALAASSGPGPVTLGDVGANVALGNVIDSANSGTTLTGNTYTAGRFDFGAVTLAANIDPTVTATGNVTMGSVDGTTAGNESLTIDAGSSTLGNVGVNAALNSLTVNGPATLTGSSYNAWNLLNFDGAATLTTASTTLNTTGNNGAIMVASVDGSAADAQSLTLTAGTGAVSLGNTGANVALGAVTDNNAITLTGTTYNAGSFYFGATTLDANTTMNTSSDNGAITLASADGSTAGGQSLALNAGTGTVSLGNAGATTRLGAVSDQSKTTLTGTTYNANSLNFGGAVTLTGNTILNTSSDNGSLTVASVDGIGTGGQNLTLTAGSGTVSLGNTGATTALGAVTDNNATTLTGTTYNANSFSFGATTLAANASINTSSDNGAITLASIDGSTAGGQNLTLNAGTGTVSLGNAGAKTELGNVTDLSNTTLTGATYTANTFDFGHLTLDNNAVMTADSTSGGTIITIGSVAGAQADTQSLTINAPGGKVSLGDVDATPADALGNVIDTNNQGTTLTGGTYEATGFNFNGLVLTSGTTTVTADGATGIIIGTLNGSNAGGQALTLTAANGTVSLGNTGTTNRLGSFTDNANTTLTGANYDANGFIFGGTVTLTAPLTTINTTQSSTSAGNITFNGNVLGTTNGAQSLTLVAGPGTGLAQNNGNITMQNGGAATLELDNMTVSGNNFSALTLFLAGNFTATLTGNLTATINANNIDITAGTVTSSELNAVNTVDLTANGVNAVNINANTLDIQATGAITGTWNVLNTEGSIDLFLNGQLTSFNAQQLIVEGFALPPGTVVTANGTLVLPAGVLIGLLSPGGGEPRMVLVHTVQALGELLSEGYVAIVIDLDGTQKDDDKMQIASN